MNYTKVVNFWQFRRPQRPRNIQKDSMTEGLYSYETFIFSSTQKSLIKMNLTKVVNFWQFRRPQRLRQQES